MLSISFYIDWRFEEELLDNIIYRIKAESVKNDPESLIISAMNIATYMEERNPQIFRGTQFTSLKVKLMSPSFAAFYYGGGACGAHTLFLARLLKKCGLKVKIVQLRVKGEWGGHITLVVENNNKLCLLDPTYNYAFKDSSGGLADIHEVANNWTAYSQRVPANYPPEYNYQSGWRYTNWDKLGILSRTIKSMGIFFYGKQKMENLSVRFYLLGRIKYYSLAALLGCLFFSLVVIIPWYKKRKAFGTPSRVRVPTRPF